MVSSRFREGAGAVAPVRRTYVALAALALVLATVGLAVVAGPSVPAGAVSPSVTNPISVGAYYSCAITSAGGVKCWGDNIDAEIGNSNGNTQVLAPSTPTGLISGVTSLAAGDEHACAIQSGAV